MASSLNGTGITFSDGSSQSIAWPGAKAQLFTSSGTFTVPAGVTSVKVTCIAGGGGGGSNTSYGSGAGGQGGWAQGVYSVTPGAAITVTVGGGGNGAYVSGGSGQANGASGGASSFGAFISATGGTGGRGGPTSAPGTNGTGSSGNIQNASSQSYIVAPPSFSGANSRFVGNDAGGGSYVTAVAFSTTLGIYPGARGLAGTEADGGVGGAVLVEW